MLIMTYPGKKLMFMGTEYAQFREWDFENSLEWFMLDYPNHKYFRDYVASLNNFYLSKKPLWEIDFDFAGFEWVMADEASKNTVVYKRIDAKGNYLIVAINFSGDTQSVRAPVEKCLRLECLFDTGNIPQENQVIDVEKTDDRYFANIVLPRFSGGIFKICKTNTKKIQI